MCFGRLFDVSQLIICYITKSDASLLGHYLLWRIGIVHGDISLSNLMYRQNRFDLVGMLNDFDLAAVVDPGTRSPPKTGWERTGTLPFMALDLLRYTKGEIKRWYRHDLESFAWCLFWEMLSVPNIKWAEGTFEEVFQLKRATMFDTGDDISNYNATWLNVQSFIESWFQCSRRFKKTVDFHLTKATILKEKSLSESETIEIRNRVDNDMSDEAHILEAVEAVRENLPHLVIRALVETSWIGVELEKTDQ